jgi:hypothetical protein
MSNDDMSEHQVMGEPIGPEMVDQVVRAMLATGLDVVMWQPEFVEQLARAAIGAMLQVGKIESPDA